MGPSAPMMMDAQPSIMTAEVESIVALEGQATFVTSLRPANGSELTNARVEVVAGAAPMEIVEQACNNRRCAVVARIPDAVENRGTPIPAPFDAENGYFDIIADQGEWRGLISVRPLDTISHLGADRLGIRGGILAADVEVIATATFEGAPTNQPIRWVITGGGSIAGTVDMSAVGSEARGGGGDGGAAGVAGDSPGGDAASGGAAATAEGGAGGGSGREAGSDGTSQVGSGASAQGVSTCASDYLAEACGGSGGGGSTDGSGGAGAGTALVVSLAPLDLTGATFLARGGDGQADAAGGGGGGNITIAAPSVMMPPSVDVSGGAGQGTGGTGGSGTLRMDVPGARMDGVVHGPVYDVASAPRITSESTYTISGFAEPDARLDFVIKDGAALGTATAASDGAFSYELALTPGLNRVVISSTGEWGQLISWLGTSFDFVRVGTEAYPTSGVLDIAYVPAME